MYRLIKHEWSRMQFLLGRALALHVFVFLSLAVSLNQSGEDVVLHYDYVYAVLPLTVVAASQLYQIFLPSFLLQEWCYGKKGGASCRVSLLLLSLLINLPLSTGLSFLLHADWLALLILWGVLDILSVMYQCITSITSQATDMLVSYILLVPICLPWLVLGQLAFAGSIAAAKLLLAAWLLISLFGSTGVLLCHRVGGGSENA